MTHYTYMHTRNDTGQPFYIGKGSGLRAWDFRPHKRGRSWAEAAAGGVEVQILSMWSTNEEAFAHEKLLIECLREVGAPLVNKASGGFAGERNGMYGRRHTEDAKKMMSDRRAPYFGSNHGRALIDERVALHILSMKGQVGRRALALQLGVTEHIVDNIWRGKTWRHLNGQAS